MRFWLWAIVAVAAVVCGQYCNSPTAEDRREDRSVLRVGTFNVEWMFAAGARPASPWESPNAVSAHVERVAEVIHAARLDVVALHEVQDCAMLQRLSALLGPAFRFYFAPGSDTATGQQSVLLTKLDPLGPVARSESRASYPVPGSTCGMRGAAQSAGVSKHGIAHMRAANFSFLFVFAHFKAGSDAASCARREAQAAVLRGIAEAAGSGPVVLAGDFNTQDDQFEDASGTRGTSLTLSTLRGSSATNLGAWLPVASRASIGRSLIDHVLVTNDLLPRVRGVWCDGSDVPQPAERETAFYSDHLPVVVELTDAGVPGATAAEALVLLAALALLCLVALAVAAVKVWRSRRQAAAQPGAAELTAVVVAGDASVNAEASATESTADEEKPVSAQSDDLA
jgi:endonuclease/exonuclease/phosphatase family metal-dependent hydrolase